MATRVRFSSQPGVTHTIPSSIPVTLEDIRRLPLPKIQDDGRSFDEMDLFTAASLGNVEIVEKRLASGVKPNECNRSSWTALLYAAHLDHKEICQVLIKAGADINQASRKGQTPLMVASACGNVSTVKLLLSEGADVHLSDRKGRQALHIASLCSQQSIVNELLLYGADPNSVDSTGMTPTLEACLAAHEQILTALLTKGGNALVRNNDGEDGIALAADNNKIIEIIEAAPRSVTELLGKMGLQKYEKKLLEQKVDSLEVFFRLNELDLTEMKIPYGPKMRMLNVIEHYEKTKEIRVDTFEQPTSTRPECTTNQQDVTATLALVAQQNETCKRLALAAFEDKNDAEKLSQLLPQIINCCDAIATRIARHPLN